MIGTIVLFVVGLVVIVGFVLRAWLQWRSRAVLPCGATVRAYGSLVYDSRHLEDQIYELSRCLQAAGVLTCEQAIDHVATMTIRLYATRDGDGPGVPYTGGARKEGTCTSAYFIDVTWRPPPGVTALKYELINALLRRYLSDDVAYAEGEAVRAEWDVCQ